MLAPTLPDGTPVDAFIVGFGANIYSEDEVMMMFGTFENATLYAETTESGCYSTGSTIQILNADGEVQNTYQIVLRGDTNGDGIIGNDDANQIRGVANWVDGYDYQWDPSLNKQAAGWACDINVDYQVDDTDVGIAKNVGISNALIDQTNGGTL